MIRAGYSYSGNGKDFFNIDWKDKRTVVYIPSSLKDSVFKRHLLAAALQKVRAVRLKKVAEHDREMERYRMFGELHPTIRKLDKAQVLDISLSPDNTTLELTEGCDHYYDISLTKSEVESLAVELMGIASKMKGEV